ncbi:unnamed protein product [Amoebophrya sp. A120]|nr:unnamed protein product [Amoebophrya sp. A120]|eukprot:GSA120T00011868001.1
MAYRAALNGVSDDRDRRRGGTNYPDTRGQRDGARGRSRSRSRPRGGEQPANNRAARANGDLDRPNKPIANGTVTNALGGQQGGKTGDQPAGGPLSEINRDTTPPFLLRIWHQHGKHHRLNTREVMKEDDELQVYTWLDVTLRELSDLIKDVVPETRKSNCMLDVRLIYPGPDGRSNSLNLGEVHSVFKKSEDYRPILLRQGRIFEIGDMLSVAILEQDGKSWTERWNPRALRLQRDPNYNARAGQYNGYGGGAGGRRNGHRGD